MNKIVRTILASLAIVVGFMATLVSCQKKSGDIKVTYYDGETVLKTESVEKGGKATYWLPVKDGYGFEGWFGTPNFSHAFDFDQEITSNTSVFANFKSTNYVEDTRTWYILGNGKSSLLKACGWSKITDKQKLTRVEADNLNKFEITLNLEEGDEFQFAINSDWENQRGAGYMTDPGDCFKLAMGSLSSSSKKSNIKVLKSGNYTLTLTTYPGEDYYDTEDSYYTPATKEKFNLSNYDTIVWKYNGEVDSKYDFTEPDLTSFQLIIKGTMTDPAWSESQRMDSVDLKVEFEYTFHAGDEFGFAWFTGADDTGYGTFINYTCLGTSGNANSKFSAVSEENQNFKALEDGTFRIKVAISAKRIVKVNFSQ